MDNTGEAEHGYVETDPTGRYGRFGDILGKGAMKTVYKAIDQVLGTEVAWNWVKLSEALRRPEDLQRLYFEVPLLSSTSLTKGPNFTTALASAISGRILHTNPIEKW